MNAYVCVYRQPAPESIEKDGWRKTRQIAAGGRSRRNKRLKKYLRLYESALYAEEGGRFYDWGDDPSFFCAQELLDDVRKASWGVCRPDVRRNLHKGDYVVFFCAQQQMECPKVWHYYYIGVGTIGQVVTNHEVIWQKRKYKKFRKFYNLLIDAEGENRETIYPRHDSKGNRTEFRWQELSEEPYIIFDSSGDLTHFNLNNPLLVATYENIGAIDRGMVMEKWKLKNRHAKKIYGLIPKRDGGKKLRTSWRGNDHKEMNLLKELNYDVNCVKKTRKALLKISREIPVS